MAEEMEVDLTDDDAARAALEFAVEVIEADADSTKVKLDAAKLILDFTKKKPAADSNVNLNTAEEFLAALAQKDK
jgi:hypothetical protein